MKATPLVVAAGAAAALLLFWGLRRVPKARRPD
jgi:hypothetical protein